MKTWEEIRNSLMLSLAGFVMSPILEGFTRSFEATRDNSRHIARPINSRNSEELPVGITTLFVCLWELKEPPLQTMWEDSLHHVTVSKPRRAYIRVEDTDWETVLFMGEWSERLVIILWVYQRKLI